MVSQMNYDLRVATSEDKTAIEYWGVSIIGTENRVKPYYINTVSGRIILQFFRAYASN
jgi:hypothetical protein